MTQPLLARLVTALLLTLPATPSMAATGPRLTVDAAADRHPISPDIYGMANVDLRMAKEIRLPMLRWGGDQSTRYNWQLDSSNVGNDWFYMAGSDKPLRPPGGTPDRAVLLSRQAGGRALLTVPIFDQLNNARGWDCSYPTSLFGPQRKVNPYVHPVVGGVRTDAGDGIAPDGKPLPPLTPEQIARAHRPNSPEFQQAWVRHLVQQFGTADHGGVAVFELDNEPGGWNNTHRDVHPEPTGHDELASRGLRYAAAVKAVDPSAQIAGPGDFVMHYQSDGRPGDGKREHGDLGQATYYLRQFKADADAHGGRRLLDYFDEHYYPFGQDGQTEQTVLDCTRSLWDPTYVERNWYGKWFKAKALIPTFHKWVDAEYPGTKVSISEYGWGDPKSPAHAVAEADVLGLFGRERVDLACLWETPKATEAMANAFRIYRNYDGRGGTFGDTAVRSVSDDQARASVYGAVRTADGALTIVAINKTTEPLTCPLTWTNFHAAASVAAYRFGGDQYAATVGLPAQTVAADGHFDADLPARSVTIYVLRPATR